MRRRRVAPILIGTVAVAVLSSGTAVAGHAAFADTAGTTHEAAIDWLADSGITAGCGNDSFCPDAGVKRGQLASFLRRLSGHDPAVPPVVNAATVDGFSVDELRAPSPILGQAESVAAATIAEYAARHTSVPVAEVAVFVPPGTRQMTQLLVTYDESYSIDKQFTPSCGGDGKAQSSAVWLRLDGERVYEIYAGSHPTVVHRDDADVTAGTTRLGYSLVTTLNSGPHTFSLSLQGACGDTDALAGGSRTVENARLSLVNGGAFTD